ncbi:MAG: hypothetical protein KJ062_10135 [Thermoanaerobaculia bacterium]|nr:hypothetical protein [Thermoanaerobaculia bacterium]
MRTTTTRSATADERTRLEAFLSPAPRRNPGRVLGLLVAFPVGYTVFVFLNLLLPSAGAVSFLLAVAAAGGAAWLFGRWAADRHAAAFRLPPEVEDLIRKDLADGRVRADRYEAEAVVKVAADPRRFVGTTWFVKLADGSVVLLVGPHFGEAEDAGQFPATAFEVASGEASHFVLSVRKLGERLAPLKTRAPLSDDEWEEIGEDDDEGVPLTWSEVLAAADRNPVQETATEAKPQARAPHAGPGASQDPPADIPAGPIRPK